MPPLPSTSVTTGLTITNPLVLYRALLATRKIDPDPSQHRLALELQKLYYKLKDYTPQEEYKTRLTAIGRIAKTRSTPEYDREAAVPGHGLRRNPLFAKLFAAKEERDTLALTRVLTNHEEAMNLDSPKGMLLHGEVGCGKSMLLDILAESLPNRKKRRWHFNTFMLETLAQLESLRKSRSKPVSGAAISVEHSLLLLAKDLIDKSPILFLDEFQLPDRAASKILSNLFTVFFQLGGVLIASSNRLPDELAKASGIYYNSPQQGLEHFGKPKFTSFPANQEYAQFVDVLKARCDVYDLTGRDWRRKEAEEMDEHTISAIESLREEMVEGFAKTNLENEQGGLTGLTFRMDLDLEKLRRESMTGKVLPPKYYLLDSSPNDTWKSAIKATVLDYKGDNIPWTPSTLVVYGRAVAVPRQFRGVCYWTFEELCGRTFGPADYITLASTFHTIILEGVPVLSLLQKNEARRLITLLDALYEARCKLVMRAEAGPDDLFFPESKKDYSDKESGERSSTPENHDDAVYPETLAEIYQDQTSPFRPNISTYTDSSRNGYDPDEDSDFGPVPGKGNEIGRRVDFGMTSSFTGEDEKFAYKRARSRLWQLCSASWNARQDPGWWTPVPLEVRRWEGIDKGLLGKSESESISDVKMGEFVELDSPAGLQGKELESSRGKDFRPPFRQERNPPPKIGWTHAWGMMTWGKKAGSWGQGIEGLKDRKKGH